MGFSCPFLANVSLQRDAEPPYSVCPRTSFILLQNPEQIKPFLAGGGPHLGKSGTRAKKKPSGARLAAHA